MLPRHCSCTLLHHCSHTLPCHHSHTPPCYHSHMPPCCCPGTLPPCHHSHTPPQPHPSWSFPLPQPLHKGDLSCNPVPAPPSTLTAGAEVHHLPAPLPILQGVREFVTLEQLVLLLKDLSPESEAMGPTSTLLFHSTSVCFIQMAFSLKLFMYAPETSRLCCPIKHRLATSQ